MSDQKAPQTWEQEMAQRLVALRKTLAGVPERQIDEAVKAFVEVERARSLHAMTEVVKGFTRTPPQTLNPSCLHPRKYRTVRGSDDSEEWMVCPDCGISRPVDESG